MRLRTEAVLADMLIMLLSALVRKHRPGAETADDEPGPYSLARGVQERNVTEFLKDRCEISSKRWITVAELREEFEDWAAARGERWAVTSQCLNEGLRQAGCIPFRRRIGDGLQARTWEGVGIKTDKATSAPRRNQKRAKLSKKGRR